MRPFTVRGWPQPGGWWLYAVRDNSTDRWSPPMTRKDARLYLEEQLGMRPNAAGKLLRMARDQHDTWVERGRPGGGTVPDVEAFLGVAGPSMEEDRHADIPGEDDEHGPLAEIEDEDPDETAGPT